MSNTNQYTYEMSLNILRALGGDPNVQYDSVDDIWTEIDAIYGASGDGIDLAALNLDIIENGTWTYNITDEVDAYVPVDITVNVPQKYTDEQVTDLQAAAREEGYTSGYETGKTDGYQEGFTEGSDDGYQDGYAEGLDDGAEEQKGLLEEIAIYENGTYEKEDGYNKVIVDVEIPTFETETLSVELTENGDYNYTPTADGYSAVSVAVNVPAQEIDTEILNVSLTENGDYVYESSKDGYSHVTINVDVAGSGSGDTSKPKIYNGFVLNTISNPVLYSRLSEIDFSQYDWSNVYDLSYFFAGFYSSSTSAGWNASSFENFKTNFNGTILSMQHCFDKASGRYAPMRVVPDFGEMTKDCIDFSYLFYSQQYMTSTLNLANWNTSNAIDMSYMFSGCSKLTSIPAFDTSNVRLMTSMFNGCSNLTSIPAFDTSNVVNMTYMFQNCSKLTSIPAFDTSNVVNMSYMFQDCSNLTSVPELDASNNQHLTIFGYSSNTTLTDLGGFKDLGKSKTISSTSNFIDVCNYLTHDSLMNVINNLYDRASAGYSTVTLKFGSTNLAKLTDDEKAIATNKGFTLS